MKTQTFTTTTAPVLTKDLNNPHAELGEEELMCAIQRGEARALETLYQRYQGLLKSVILRIVHDHASADDVLQDCLVDLWRHAEQYSPSKGKPLGWIITLSRRRAIDYLRRCTSYTNAKDRLENETVTYTTTQDAGTDCEQADLSRVITEHLSRLPAPQQEVIELAYLKGMSQREIAAATHSPLGTVKTRLELGLRKLRDALRTRSSISCMQHAA